MIIGAITIKLYAPWVHSLKEKRMIVKSLCGKLKNKFNLSVIEAEDQDVHQTIVIAAVYAAQSQAQGDSILEHVINFVEENTEAQVLEVSHEYR
ncbi:DUF503 domain-containing protein [Sinanaerobacter chloroacetimidivorans]|jgi:uncharacterized protein YlxP (DUF503 family)|uniref:DUF503 domain-containing protein n=1 Tax=Sinanaerobacter chloroacetimidivorans TaxID=2818044 RepID=A0A8J8B5S3_9FIRM|nr:DUF503 domain-containing protein [Sinanaerobacter chloroacetimidivorans]MBR0600610.1 DUF503 domain-containing protein [Sinanaerobacter chloroacetimidivorans]